MKIENSTFKKKLSISLQFIVILPFRINRNWTRFVLRLRPSWSVWLMENSEKFDIDERKKKIIHLSYDGVETELQILTPNSINFFRANTFSTKEPETLEWIDEFGKNGVLYDVGANIGLYSLYFAKKHTCPVYAFEPSVFNLEYLARNIALNKLNKLITIIPVALTDETSISTLHVSDTRLGGAHSSFGSKIGHDGRDIEFKFEYKCLGSALDFLVDNAIIRPATMMKIDVDGIEDLVLCGAENSLEDHNLKTVLIEVNEDFKRSGDSISDKLNNAGFILRSKHQSEMFKDTVYGNSFNQIWVRHES